MIPTTRTAMGLAVLGVLAFIIPPWLSIALMLALIAAAAADGWSVRRSPAILRSVPEVLYRNAPVELAVHADGRDHHLMLRQPPGVHLQVTDAEGMGSLTASLVATRRGLQTLPGVASASVGPLGLTRVHHRASEPLTVKVMPDLPGAGRLITRLRRSRPGLTGGRARGPLGLGTEFESVREYTADDDIRSLNWRASARLDRPMSNQYRVERDRDVICVIDTGRLMLAPVGDGGTVLDLALDAVTVIALAADELGDRFGVLAFDDEIRLSMAPRHRGGRAAVRSLFDLEPRSVDSDFELALSRSSRFRRSLVFIFTDLLDEAAARSLAAGVRVIARRHAAFVVSAADPAVDRLAADMSAPGHALAALQVLTARRQAVMQLRRAGSRVLEATPDHLAERCLDAYVTAKLRARI